MPDSTLSWFVAQHKPNSHRIAERNLRRQGFRTFLPVQELTRRSPSGFVSQLRPLFPGYVFVALDPALGGWRAINSTFGVTRLVTRGNDPGEVPAEIVLGLMERCDETGKLRPPPELRPGDEVTVTRGPFADFVATIERIAPDRRIWVLLELMGQQTRVSVSEEAVRRTT